MADNSEPRMPCQRDVINVLQGNRHLLVNNIVLCDEVYRLLKDYKVLPSVMIDEIKSVENREKANILLLEHVARLGYRTLAKFCDVLTTSGHVFLAEHIKTEIEHADPNNRRDPYDDVFKRFPATLKVLSPGEQRALSNYIKEKVADGIIKSAWKARTTHEARRADEQTRKVTEAIYKDRIICENEEEINSLKRALDIEKQSHTITQESLADLQIRVRDLQIKYNDQLRIMMTSYDASERANMECDSRLGIFDRQIKAMNVQIQKYLGVDEYAAQADAGNVKVSRLQENVNRILDTLIVTEQEVNEMHRKYDEERRLLFEALGLDDNGQDLRRAFLDSQQKMNSEVKRLTAEVDLLSMAFEMESVWSLFEEERQPKSGTGQKASGGDGKKRKGKPGRISHDISDFDYSHVLSMIRKRLHEIHMEIERLKRANLAQERRIGKLRGKLDLIHLRGQVDDPEDLKFSDKVNTDNVNSPKPERSSRRDGVHKTWNNSTKLSPVPESYLNRDSATPIKTSGGPEVLASDMAPSERQQDRLPPIDQSGTITTRSDPPTSPRQQINKKYPHLSMDKQIGRQPSLREDNSVLGYGRNDNMSKRNKFEKETNAKYSRENDLKTLNFQGVLPDSRSRVRRN